MIMISVSLTRKNSHQNSAFYSSFLFQRVMVVLTVQRAFLAPGITEPRHTRNMLSPATPSESQRSGSYRKANQRPKGNTSEMRTPNQGLALGLDCDPWDIRQDQAQAREKLFPGNAVTVLGSRSAQRRLIRVRVHQVTRALKPQRDATHSSLGGNSL